MNSLIALGFYATHPDIMDLLNEVDSFTEGFDEYCKDEGVPDDLKRIAQESEEFFTTYFKKLREEDLPSLEDALLKCLQDRLVVQSAREMPALRSQWAGKVRLCLKDGRRARASTTRELEFGWEWSTRSNELVIDIWGWTRGGRAAERFLANKIKDWSNGPLKLEMGKDLNWRVAGTIRLGEVNVSNLVKEDFSLDQEAIVKHVDKHFAWVNDERIHELFCLPFAT